MANDLQALYKMRDILKREEYTKAYNDGVNENLKNSVNASLASWQGQKNSAWANYNRVKEGKVRAAFLKKSIITPLIIFAISFVVLLLITLSVSKNVQYGLMYFFVSYASCTLYSMIGVLGQQQPGNKGYEYYSGLKTALFWIFFLTCLALSVYFAVSSGALSGGFWRFVLAILVFVMWIFANFFFVGKASWWMLLVLAAIYISLISVFVMMTSMGTLGSKAESDPDVRAAKARYDKACADYDAAYNSQYAKMKAAFSKMLKPDTTTQEKRAMLPMIPQQFQNFDMVNKLIWCIEQRYAYDIVGARNWYLQQEHNAAMQQKMNSIVSEVRRSNDIAAQAAADARAAHAEAMKAMSTLNKNVEQSNKLAEKGNQIARENAAANQKAADYAEKVYDQLK